MDEPPPPDEDSRTRRLVLLYGFAGFASSLASRTLDPVLPELAAEFAVTVEAVALVASAFALPYALIQPILGPVGDGLGKRRVILVATALTALLLFACALAPGVVSLFVARALAGAAAGGIFPLTIATFGDEVPIARRQVALSRVLALSIAGQIAGGVISGAVSDDVGWRAVQAAGATIQLVAALVLWRDLRARPDAPPGRVDVAGSLRRYAEIARIPQARRLWAAVAAEGVLVFGLFPYVAALVARWGFGGAPQAGLALSAFGVAGIAYAALSAVLLRRLGLTRMLRLAGILGLAGMLGVAATGWLGAGHPWGIGGVVGGMLVLGLGYFAMHNSIQTGITDVAPHARGSAVAVHAFCFFLGQSIGPAVFGAGLAGVGAPLTLAAMGVAMLGLGLGLSRTILPRG